MLQDVSLGYTSGTTVTFRLAQLLQPLTAQSPRPITDTSTVVSPQSTEGFTMDSSSSPVTLVVLQEPDTSREAGRAGYGTAGWHTYNATRATCVSGSSDTNFMAKLRGAFR